MVPNGPIESNIVQIWPKSFLHALTMSKTVQMVQKEVQSGPKWSKNSPELSNIVQIHPKFLLKMTTVGATTVVVAAVRNNLEFGTIIKIGSTNGFRVLFDGHSVC